MTLMLTMDGIPCIYYGTEQNFDGGNDPANREPLWGSGYKTDNDTFKHISALTALRQEYALRRGDMKVLWSTDNVGDEQDAGILAFERTYKGETVLVIINTNMTKASLTSSEDTVMQTTFDGGTKLKDIFPGSAGKTVTVESDGTLDLSLPSQSAMILVK